MAKTNDFEYLPCPHCGKKGLRWDFTADQARCPHCHLSGFPTESKGDKGAAKPKKEKPKPLTNKDIEREAMNANLSEKVTETYTHEHPNGEHGNIVVERIIPVVPADKIPDLTVNFKSALFHRWRLRDLIDREKRWGRDDLRKRGFMKIGRGIDPVTQKAISVIARPGEENDAGSGRYALGHAIAVIRRAEQKLKGEDGDNFDARDD